MIHQLKALDEQNSAKLSIYHKKVPKVKHYQKWYQALNQKKIMLR